MSLIEVTTTGAVRTVTLNRPEKHNALNPGMMDTLRAAFEAEPPPEERVTVIRGKRSSGIRSSTGIASSPKPRSSTTYPASSAPPRITMRTSERVAPYPTRSASDSPGA